MNLTKRTAVFIVDFDNFFDLYEPSFTFESLEYSLTQLITTVVIENKKIDDVQIRLYGGWYQNDGLTRNASRLQQMLSQIQLFPLINSDRIITGQILVTSNLLELPSFIWTNTYKETDGIKSVRIKRELLSDVCDGNGLSCPPMMIKKFTKRNSRVCHMDGCSVTYSEVVKGMEQKMVDTLMACDVVSCGDEDLVEEIVVLSDDTDLLPSILLVREKSQGSKRITLFKQKVNPDSPWIGHLNEFGVNVKIVQL